MVRNIALITARHRQGLSQDQLAQRVQELGRRLGRPNACTRGTVHRWESGDRPQPMYLMLLEAALDQPADALGFGEGTSLPLPPAAMPAATLAGDWLTAYTYSHQGQQLCHADIAHVTATSDAHVSIANGPAATEGRAVPFTNQVEADLVSRHLVGLWRNLSDTRYFGGVHLAVMPGENTMDGIYSGFASDITVSSGRWRWVRLADGDTAGVHLPEPRLVYTLVMAHHELDKPLTLTDITGDSAWFQGTMPERL